MPRKSAAELEMTLIYQEKTGREVEVPPPKSLTNVRQRNAFKALLFQYPHLTGRRNFEAILANYVLCQANAQRLRNSGDDAGYYEVFRAVKHFEEFLGLPSAAEPPRRRTVEAP